MRFETTHSLNLTLQCHLNYCFKATSWQKERDISNEPIVAQLQHLHLKPNTVEAELRAMVKPAN